MYLNSDWGPAPTGRSGSHPRWREEPATGRRGPCSRWPKAGGSCSLWPKAGGKASQSLRPNPRLPWPKAACRAAGGRPEQMGDSRCASARLRLCRTCVACCGNGCQTVDGNKRRGGGRITEERDILSSVTVFCVWLHSENKDLIKMFVHRWYRQDSNKLWKNLCLRKYYWKIIVLDIVVVTITMMMYLVTVTVTCVRHAIRE